MTTAGDELIEAKLIEVRELMGRGLRQSSLQSLADPLMEAMGTGKMLRSRLIWRVGVEGEADEEDMLLSSAAVELMHAASLLHDDVVDGSELRRNLPSFWAERGVPAAVLLGDLLFCQASGLLLQAPKRELVTLFSELSEKMCEAELEHELLLGRKIPDWDTRLSLAGRKTGSLFAFAACVAGGDDPALCSVLKEAGHAVGTAYQLADDLHDEPAALDYSPGTGENGDPRRAVGELCASSLEMLSPWPAVQTAWQVYLDSDFYPAVTELIGSLSVQ